MMNIEKSPIEISGYRTASIPTYDPHENRVVDKSVSVARNGLIGADSESPEILPIKRR